jgi:glycosyltransferase involved in cell wall biosynthesis
MRVLIVHNQLWAHYKSKLFEEVHRNLSERYPQAVFRVIQIGLYESSRLSMQSDDTGIYNYPYQLLFRESLDRISFPARLKALFSAYREFRPDVLNITGYYDWAQIFLMCIAKAGGVKVVLSSESSAADHRRSPLREAVKRWIVSRADAFFCFGTTSAEYLKHLGAPEKKIAVRNAAVIDDRRIREEFLRAGGIARKHSPAFIFVGRLAEEKNLELLLEAYRKARSQSPVPWDLILVGDGPMKKEITGYIEKEKLDGVTIAGGVAWVEVPEWLSIADVLILPSYSEPWGLVVNEALVCGLPVIVSEKCGCAGDLVEAGKNGYLFDPYKADELAAHMVSFMEMPPDQLRAYGAHGQAIVSKFAADKVAAEMVNTYVSLSRIAERK